MNKDNFRYVSHCGCVCKVVLWWVNAVSTRGQNNTKYETLVGTLTKDHNNNNKKNKSVIFKYFNIFMRN